MEQYSKKERKIINIDVWKENMKGHNPNWPNIPDHNYRLLIIVGFGTGKSYLLFNLMRSNISVAN